MLALVLATQAMLQVRSPLPAAHQAPQPVVIEGDVLEVGGRQASGAIVQAQFWYRDPENTSNQATSLSDAIEFVVSP